MTRLHCTNYSKILIHRQRIFKETIFLTYSIKLAVEILDDPNGRNPATSDIATICSTTKRKKNTCYPFFPPEFLSFIQASWIRAVHTSKPLSRARGKGGEAREEGKKGGGRGGEWRRKAARGKENLADPLSLFTPPGAGARVESPLATVYWTHANIHGNEGPPWEATPVASSFCVLVGGVRKVFQRYRGGRRGKRKLEPLGKISFWSATYSSHFLIPSLCLANSPPLEQTDDCCSKQ